MSLRKPVTGAEAGLPGEKQILIALQIIASNGGIASTQQVYSGVDFYLGPKATLSKQGKDSLRYFVNHVAVDSGYIHPYDDNEPGWRSTKTGVEFLEQNFDDPKLRILTQASGNFAFAVSDIYHLLDFYDEQTGTGRPDPRFEVLKRTGVILTITAWETFVEDVLTAEFTKQLDQSKAPGDVQSVFNLVAQKWQARIRGDGRDSPKPPTFVQWTGDNWKHLLKENFENDIASLNTPNSQNTRKLFKRYLGFDVTSDWRWPGMSSETACSRLDALIELRGELVHRGSDPLERRARVPRRQLEDAVNLVERLVRSTQVAIDKCRT